MIIRKAFYYPPAQTGRTLHIYLPDNYSAPEMQDEKYPVMYFFDGQNLFSDAEATYGKCWGLSDFLNYWYKDMIVVGIECGHGEGERLEEYDPYPRNGKENRGAETAEWVADKVKPYIDCMYRTWPQRGATAIGGSSMGGLMALYALINKNGIFSKAACVSSALWQGYDRIKEDIEKNKIDPDTRVWLSWGTVESGADSRMIDNGTDTWYRNKTIADMLAERGCWAQLYCQLGGRHCEADWEKQVPYFMEFLWQ